MTQEQPISTKANQDLSHLATEIAAKMGIDRERLTLKLYGYPGTGHILFERKLFAHVSGDLDPEDYRRFHEATRHLFRTEQVSAVGCEHVIDHDEWDAIRPPESHRLVGRFPVAQPLGDHRSYSR